MAVDEATVGRVAVADVGASKHASVIVEIAASNLSRDTRGTRFGGGATRVKRRINACVRDGGVRVRSAVEVTASTKCQQ